MDQTQSKPAFPVHPRVRGERAAAAYQDYAVCGSSPRARGTRETSPCRARTRRFIPACAGNAHDDHGHDDRGPVHPRVRGERLAESCVIHACNGSSPRARGTPFGHLAQTPGRRFIPACAGNASAHISRMAPGSVHPRVRGERWWYSPMPTLSHGSSPRARGTPTTSTP